jgi:tubulin--tyrosine ligase
VGRFWEGVVDVAVAGFFGLEVKEKAEADMVLVREVEMGRR